MDAVLGRLYSHWLAFWRLFLGFFDPSGGGVFSNADIASSNFTPLKSSS
jgi:hypothetical protein